MRNERGKPYSPGRRLRLEGLHGLRFQVYVRNDQDLPSLVEADIAACVENAAVQVHNPPETAQSKENKRFVPGPRRSGKAFHIGQLIGVSVGYAAHIADPGLKGRVGAEELPVDIDRCLFIEYVQDVI